MNRVMLGIMDGAESTSSSSMLSFPEIHKTSRGGVVIHHRDTGTLERIQDSDVQFYICFLLPQR